MTVSPFWLFLESLNRGSICRSPDASRFWDGRKVSGCRDRGILQPRASAIAAPRRGGVSSARVTLRIESTMRGTNAEARLVEHQEAGPRHEAGRDREHLALAARQRAGALEGGRALALVLARSFSSRRRPAPRRPEEGRRPRSGTGDACRFRRRPDRPNEPIRKSAPGPRVCRICEQSTSRSDSSGAALRDHAQREAFARSPARAEVPAMPRHVPEGHRDQLPSGASCGRRAAGSSPWSGRAGS